MFATQFSIKLKYNYKSKYEKKKHELRMIEREAVEQMVK